VDSETSLSKIIHLFIFYFVKMILQNKFSYIYFIQGIKIKFDIILHFFK
jgi:hypothetical protein